jgi:hypothetical protein
MPLSIRLGFAIQKLLVENEIWDPETGRSLIRKPLLINHARVQIKLENETRLKAED